MGHTDIVSSIAFTKDQKTLLSASWDGSIRLWDVGTGLMSSKLKASGGALHAAIFWAEEKDVVSEGADRVIRVWDIAASKVTREYRGH